MSTTAGQANDTESPRNIVVAGDFLGTGQIGDGAAHLQDAVRRTRALKFQIAHGELEQFLGWPLPARSSSSIRAKPIPRVAGDRPLVRENGPA